MRVKQILFTTDFSDCAERAFSHASYLAARYHAGLHVLNVAMPRISADGDPLDFMDLRPEDDNTWSDAYTADHPDQEIPIVHIRMTADSPVDGILTYAERHDIDLIVMGTHGRTGIDHLLSGSVAEDVVRYARCPVLTVRCNGDAGWKEDVKRILVPLDFSEFTPLPAALKLARAYDAEVDLLHVLEQSVLPTIYGVEPLSSSVPLYVERTKGAMEKLVRELSAEGLTVNMYVRMGHPPRRILDLAQERRSDLIVVGSHGRTGLGRLLMGSVAEKVVRLANVPVFTVKDGGDVPRSSGRTMSAGALK